MQKLCLQCGTVNDYRVRVMKGSMGTEILLWLFFLVPGVIYSIWRHTTVYYGCPKCKGPNTIPTDSPMAQKILGTMPVAAPAPPAALSALLPPPTGKPISPARAWAIVGSIVAAFVLAAVFGGSSNPPTKPAQTAASGVASQDPASGVAVAPTKPGELRAERRAYAKKFDQAMLDVGMESTTRTAGKQDTTLRISYALTGRVTANALSKNIDWDKLRELGFKKVVLTNDFEGETNETYYWNVD